MNEGDGFGAAAVGKALAAHRRASHKEAGGADQGALCPAVVHMSGEQDGLRRPSSDSLGLPRPLFTCRADADDLLRAESGTQ